MKPVGILELLDLVDLVELEETQGPIPVDLILVVELHVLLVVVMLIILANCVIQTVLIMKTSLNVVVIKTKKWMKLLIRFLKKQLLINAVVAVLNNLQPRFLNITAP